MKPYAQEEDLEMLNKKESDLEEHLNKLLEANIEKITTCTQVLNVTQKIGTVTFLIFLVLLGFKMKFNIRSFMWVYVIIPLVISLISFTIMIHMYLKLKDIMDDAERFEEEGKHSSSVNFGTFISYLCLYALSINFLVYLICFSFKMDFMIFTKWNTIAITIYINLVIFLFYTVFVLPAFIQNKLYFEISFILSYLINSTAFILMLNLKLDQILDAKFYLVFIPLYIALSYHFLFSIVNLFLTKGGYFGRICVVIFLGSTLLFSALINSKLDGYLSTLPDWVPVLGIILGIKILMLEKICGLICCKNKDNE